MQVRINNNTDLHIARLLVVYQAELATVDKALIESITFDACRMLVWGVDCLLLEVDERDAEWRLEETLPVGIMNINLDPRLAVRS